MDFGLTVDGSLFNGFVLTAVVSLLMLLPPMVLDDELAVESGNDVEDCLPVVLVLRLLLLLLVVVDSMLCKKGSQEGWTARGNMRAPMAANSCVEGTLGGRCSRIPTRWSSDTSKAPLRPLQPRQHVTALSHVSRPPRQRGRT
jgi:hypothetical protein